LTVIIYDLYVWWIDGQQISGLLPRKCPHNCISCVCLSHYFSTLPQQVVLGPIHGIRGVVLDS
jgi:hypothetical protein